MKLHFALETAYKVLDGTPLSEAEALALTELSGSDILDLVSLANKVRDKFAPKIVPCSIINAKSGVCSQNCKFCAQSAHHATGIDTYPLLDPEEIVSTARKIYAEGVRSYGIVTSGCGYLEADAPEFRKILDAMDRLHHQLLTAVIGHLYHDYPCFLIGIVPREYLGKGYGFALGLVAFYIRKGRSE